MDVNATIYWNFFSQSRAGMALWWETSISMVVTCRFQFIVWVEIIYYYLNSNNDYSAYKRFLFSYPALGKSEEQLPQKTVGRLLVNSRPSVGQQLAHSGPTVGQLLGNSQPTVGLLLAVCRPTFGSMLVICWPIVGWEPLSNARKASQGRTLHIDMGFSVSLVLVWSWLAVDSFTFALTVVATTTFEIKSTMKPGVHFKFEWSICWLHWRENSKQKLLPS